MKRVIPLFFLMLSLTGKAWAEEVNALTLWMVSGSKVVCLLDEQPVVTFTGDEIVLSTHMNKMSYPTADVLKFTHSYVDPTGIAQSGVAGTCFLFDGNFIKAFNLEPRSEVEVYSVDGSLLSETIADGSGNVCVSVPAQPGVVFIIKTLVANFKIMKP